MSDLGNEYKLEDRFIFDSLISNDGYYSADRQEDGNYLVSWDGGCKFYYEIDVISMIENGTWRIKPNPAATEKEYSLKHYDSYYALTDKDIETGKIKLDAYFVAKQWKVGSKDDSGALFHSLKTIARFGEKNSVEREIKALYNQAKAMARIYCVDLDD